MASTLAVASPARAAEITSVTPNPAPANALLTVVADCNDTAAFSAMIVYNRHRGSDGVIVNFHQNEIVFPSSDPDSAKDFTDSYDTSGIESPGIGEGDYYSVSVECFIPEAPILLEPVIIPILASPPGEPEDPADDPDRLAETGVASDVASAGITAGVLGAALGIALLVVARRRAYAGTATTPSSAGVSSSGWRGTTRTE